MSTAVDRFIEFIRGGNPTVLCKHGNNWCKGIAGSDDQQCVKCFSSAVFNRATMATQPTGPLPGPLNPAPTPTSTVYALGEQLHNRLMQIYARLGGISVTGGWHYLSTREHQAYDELAREVNFQPNAIAVSSAMHDEPSSSLSFDSIMERLLAMDEPVRQKAYVLLHASGCKINR